MVMTIHHRPDHITGVLDLSRRSPSSADGQEDSAAKDALAQLGREAARRQAGGRPVGNGRRFTRRRRSAARAGTVHRRGRRERAAGQPTAQGRGATRRPDQRGCRRRSGGGAGTWTEDRPDRRWSHVHGAGARSSTTQASQDAFEAAKPNTARTTRRSAPTISPHRANMSASRFRDRRSRRREGQEQRMLLSAMRGRRDPRVARARRADGGRPLPFRV